MSIYPHDDSTSNINIRVNVCNIMRFIYCSFLRRSSSGDHLSITPDNLSPSPNSSGSLLNNRSSHRSLSNINSTNANGNGGQKSSGSTSYHSSTLPLRKHRNKVSSDEKSKKVQCVCMCVHVHVMR